LKQDRRAREHGYSPCFGTITTSSELLLILLMQIKMVVHECNLGRHLTNRQGAVVTHQGVAADCLGAAANCQDVVTDCLGVVIDRLDVITDCLGAAANGQGAVADHQGATDLVALRSKRLSLRDVFTVEAIDLDIWIFTPAP
jgi:hypothetical protein